MHLDSISNLIIFDIAQHYSGYIAAMQSTILKNSKCIIMFGGMSNFQGSILYGYKEKHPNCNACIYEVCYKEHKYV